MSIWHRPPDLESLNQFAKETLSETLGIHLTEVGDDFLQATMAVDHRTVQPLRLLHGGASVALAETLGSIAATLCVDGATKSCVGLEINANHVRAAREGTVVTGTVTPLHIGRSTHIWQIQIRDEKDRLVCVSRITMAILDRPSA